MRDEDDAAMAAEIARILARPAGPATAVYAEASIRRARDLAEQTGLLVTLFTADVPVAEGQPVEPCGEFVCRPAADGPAWGTALAAADPGDLVPVGQPMPPGYPAPGPAVSEMAQSVLEGRGGIPSPVPGAENPPTADLTPPRGVLAAGEGRRTVLVLSSLGEVEMAYQGPALNAMAAVGDLAAQFARDPDDGQPYEFTRVKIAGALWQVTAAGGAP